jgi:hypothetical protein
MEFFFKLTSNSVRLYLPGVGVMMLLVLTVERYVSVCHPGSTQPVMGPPRLIVPLIPLFTFLLYLPSAFRYQLRLCASPDGPLFYEREDRSWPSSVIYLVYKVCGVCDVSGTSSVSIIKVDVTDIYTSLSKLCLFASSLLVTTTPTMETGDL